MNTLQITEEKFLLHQYHNNKLEKSVINPCLLKERDFFSVTELSDKKNILTMVGKVYAG